MRSVVLVLVSLACASDGRRVRIQSERRPVLAFNSSAGWTHFRHSRDFAAIKGTQARTHTAALTQHQHIMPCIRLQSGERYTSKSENVISKFAGGPSAGLRPRALRVTWAPAMRASLDSGMDMDGASRQKRFSRLKRALSVLKPIFRPVVMLGNGLRARFRAGAGARVKSQSDKHVDWMVELLSNQELRAASWRAAESSSEMPGGIGPDGLTYGEFDFQDFFRVIDMATAVANHSSNQLTICDLGSGMGRLVLAAAARQKWKRCIGLEILPELNAMAMQLHAAAKEVADREGLPLSPCDFFELDMSSAAAAPALADVDIGFAFSTCFGDVEFAESMRSLLPIGAFVITIDALLPNSDHGIKPSQRGFFLLRGKLGLSKESEGQGSIAYIWQLCASRPSLSVDYDVLRVV